jgi:hypothetical protein
VYRCADYKSRGQKGYPGQHPKACGPGLISRSPGLIRSADNADRCARGRSPHWVSPYSKKKSRKARR